MLGYSSIHAIILSIGIVLLAAASPLLTSARLFQLKEWRWDRLREHCQREGWRTSLVGTVRPIIVIFFLLVQFTEPNLPTDAGISTLAALSVMQLMLHKQPHPVWTSKAILLTSMSVVIDAICAWAIVTYVPAASPALLLLALGQPLVLGMAMLLVSPLDRILKQRILTAAANERRKHDLTVIAVVGSTGKTTTKELLKQALASKNPIATPEHVNTELGVASWLVRSVFPSFRSPRSQVPSPIIVEMGSYRRGEIAVLCTVAQPTIGVLTSLGRDHLGLFGSADAIREANAELFDALPSDGHAFVNGDSDACRQAAERCRCPVTYVGTNADCSLRAEQIREDDKGLHFRVREVNVELPLFGKHNVTNTLLALAVAEHCGIPLAVAAKELADAHPVAHTFRVVSDESATILDDTYNSSPESMRAAITWAKERPEAEKVLLTSGIMELGKEQDVILEELGRNAQGVFRRIIFTTDAGRSAFARGANQEAELLNASTARITKGSLLACIGRMPLSSISLLLPSS